MSEPKLPQSNAKRNREMAAWFHVLAKKLEQDDGQYATMQLLRAAVTAHVLNAGPYRTLAIVDDVIMGLGK